jgi:hypothetical protein
MSETQKYVESEILCYLYFYLNRYPNDNLKTVIAECCSHEDIVCAKKIAIEVAEDRYRDCLKDIKDNRRDTTQRLAKFANVQDILTILRAFDESMIETPVFIARDLDKLPRVKPDDACNMVSLADRMNKLEMQVNQLQECSLQQTNTTENPALSQETAVKSVHVAESNVETREQNENINNDHAIHELPNDSTDDFVLTREEKRRLKRRERMSWPGRGDESRHTSPARSVRDEPNRKSEPRQPESTERRTDYDDPSNSNAKVIMLCDSVARHIKPALFFGSRYAKLVKTGWASTSTAAMRKWKNNSQVEYVVLHCGIRDVRDCDKSADDIIADTIECMESAATKYSNALVMFSEILLTPDDDMNDDIVEINRNMKHFCEDSERFRYVPHSLIQRTDSMFDDDTHINNDRGTKTFVRDITSAALGPRRRVDARRDNHRIHGRDPSPGSRTHSVSGMRSDTGFPGNTRQQLPQQQQQQQQQQTAWKSVSGTVDSVARSNEDNGAKDLIKLFASLLARL